MCNLILVLCVNVRAFLSVLAAFLVSPASKKKDLYTNQIVSFRHNPQHNRRTTQTQHYNDVILLCLNALITLTITISGITHHCNADNVEALYAT